MLSGLLVKSSKTLAALTGLNSVNPTSITERLLHPAIAMHLRTAGALGSVQLRSNRSHVIVLLPLAGNNDAICRIGLEMVRRGK